LENIPIQQSNISKIIELTDVLHRIKERFVKTPLRSSLVKDSDWPRLIGGLKELTLEIKINCRQGWSNFKQEYFSGHSPEMLELSVVKTQKNITLLADYKKLHRELVFLDKENEKLDSIKTFKTKGKLLQAIAKELMEFQAPDEVKKFLMAISGSGAPLELLTEEVTIWLKEQGLSSKYRIVGVS